MAKKLEQRKVLVILSNRFNRSQKPHYFELDCKSDGTVLEERKLRREPRKPEYDEVWENDDGKSSIDSCPRMSRKYRHSLEKKPAA